MNVKLPPLINIEGTITEVSRQTIGAVMKVDVKGKSASIALTEDEVRKLLAVLPAKPVS
jgi:hypothetical protein